MTPRMVGEKEGAGRPLTGLHLRKVLRADEIGQRLGDGEQQRVEVAPATPGLALEAPWARRRKDDAAKGFVALEQVG